MNKTVLITGCSSGFGKATAKLFAHRNWNVVATMRRPDVDPQFAALDNVLVTQLDVQDRKSIERAVNEGIARFERIDVLINNAGFGLSGIFETTPREKIAEQFDVNVFGVMDVTRAVLPHFRANGSGVVVNVSSGAGVFTLPMLSLYCASKFALEGFSEAVSYELSSQNIVVKLVEPGGVLSTNFFKRNGIEADHVEVPPSYAAFVGSTNTTLANLKTQWLAGDGDVAKIIYNAATDGTDRLRYVATDEIKPLIKARRETSEESYIETMRSRFFQPT